MKKAILLFAVASVMFASCGNSNSTTPTVDTSAKITVVDSSKAKSDTVSVKPVDSVKKNK